MSDVEIAEAILRVEGETGLPCCDPIRHGAGRIVDNLLRLVP